MNSAQTVKPELRNQFLHQSWPHSRVMLSQSSSSPQDLTLVYHILHISLALNIHIVAVSGDQLKLSQWGKNSPGVQPPAGDSIRRSMLRFPLFHGLSADPLYPCLGKDLIFSS